jgi:hypothetical protein
MDNDHLWILIRQIGIVLAVSGAVGAVVGIVFGHRTLRSLFATACITFLIFLYLCFKEGILSLQFSVWENVAEFFLEQFFPFLLLWLLPAILVALLVGPWGARHWPKHSKSI